MYTLKKSLGQHFLHDENMIRKIVASLKEYPFDHLLEVGPGAGALTKELLNIPGIDFRAVELDDEKVQYLEQNFPAIRGKIIHRNFLDIDAPFDQPFTVIGNFPYNISTQIVFKIIDWKALVPEVVGMFQKEVAQRAASKPGSKVYGVLSVMIQAYYDVDYLFDVNPGCFTPPPKVMSAVIRLRRKPVPVQAASDRAFSIVVKTAFNQRRKTLRNALKALFDADVLQDPIFDRRAETLSVEDFATLTFRMKSPSARLPIEKGNL